MIHAELDAIKQKWYTIGNTDRQWTNDEYTELKALDNWQRNEVLKAHAKGVADRVEII